MHRRGLEHTTGKRRPAGRVLEQNVDDARVTYTSASGIPAESGPEPGTSTISRNFSTRTHYPDTPGTKAPSSYMDAAHNGEGIRRGQNLEGEEAPIVIHHTNFGWFAGGGSTSRLPAMEDRVMQGALPGGPQQTETSSQTREVA
jgi:hypothetical protein